MSEFNKPSLLYRVNASSLPATVRDLLGLSHKSLRGFGDIIRELMTKGKPNDLGYQLREDLSNKNRRCWELIEGDEKELLLFFTNKVISNEQAILNIWKNRGAKISITRFVLRHKEDLPAVEKKQINELNNLLTTIKKTLSD